MAVIDPKKGPERIDWWFCDPGAEILAGPHPWGSLNWWNPHYPTDQIGEVVGAKRPWRDGSKPPGACGGVALQTPCFQGNISDVLYASLTIGSHYYAFPITHVTLSDPSLWRGSVAGLDACALYRVELSCEEVILPGPAIGWQWDLRLYGGNGSATDALDSMGFPGPTAPPLSLEMVCPNVTAACDPGATGLAKLLVSGQAPGRITLI